MAFATAALASVFVAAALSVASILVAVNYAPIPPLSIVDQEPPVAAQSFVVEREAERAF
jgi:hypothetical protein